MNLDVPDDAHCHYCGYSLRQLTVSRCPECGEAFDPDDPTTYRSRTSRPQSPLKPLTPPSILFLSFLSICAAIIVAGRLFSESAAPGCAPIAAICVGFILICRWRTIAECRRANESFLLREFTKRPWRWRYQVIVSLILIISTFYNLPRAMQLVLSWPWLAHYGASYLNDRPRPALPTWLGFTHVEYVWGRGQSFVWYQTAWENGDRLGFVYVTSRDAEIRGEKSWLAPGWYYARW